MEDVKLHPSELLEFPSLNSTFSTHLEHSPWAGCNSNESTTKDGNQPDPTTRSEAQHQDPSAPYTHGNFPSLNNDANLASQKEHRMTLLQALRLYPKAITWSALLSLAIVMEGYDTALINSFYAFGPFQKRYGVPSTNGTYQLTTTWQNALNNGSVVGSIIGLFLNGFLSERFGYRPTMIGALITLAAFIFFSFFAFTVGVLLAGQVLCGLSWGIFQTLTVTYAAEVMPLALRASLTANVNLCWLIGQITALGILRGMININSEWSYRIPFGLQWVWIIVVLAGTLMAPESPWLLVRQGRIDDARKSLLRLTRRGADYNVDHSIALMVQTDELEKRLHKGVSYMDLFRGQNLRRTEIVCMVWATQLLCLPVIGYATYFFLSAGISERHSFDLSISMQGLAICANLISQPLMRYFGRRTLYLVGLSLLFLILLLCGILSSLPSSTHSSSGALWALASLVVLFIFVFDATVGPITYTLVAEIPSTRLRVKTVVFGRVVYNVVSIGTNVLQTHMLNPLAWNWKGKSCFVWAGTCLLCYAYCYIRLPETSGLTYMELDILFEKGAEARKFRAFQKRLKESGYFSFGNEEEEVWGEPGRGPVTFANG